ncbi:MAG TPA: hypothetical protein VGG28_15480 [Kofleriaceae bacterium]|jgi:hypothetical protein
MTDLRVAVLVALAACGVQQSSPPADDDSLVPLSVDTYFILSTPDCDAPSPEDCVMELGFCTDGSYARKHGEAIMTSSYGVDDQSIAVDTSAAFQFDFQDDRSDDANGNMLGPWNPTTVDTDADVRCHR